MIFRSKLTNNLLIGFLIIAVMLIVLPAKLVDKVSKTLLLDDLTGLSSRILKSPAVSKMLTVNKIVKIKSEHFSIIFKGQW